MMSASSRHQQSNPPDRRFPLEWPIGWKRTPGSARTRSLYRVTPEKAMKGMLDEARKLRARNVVISTNVVLRNDGFPRMGVKAPDDPAVALYFVDRKGRDTVIACDQWDSVHENMHAIGLAIGALRMLERCGASELLERAYQGFLALPANVPDPGATPKRHWREVMGFSLDPSRASRRWLLDPDPSSPGKTILEARYRSLATSLHPDAPNGSAEFFIELNAAYDEAKKELEVG